MKSKGAFICAFKSSQVLRWIKGVLQRSYKFGRGGGGGWRIGMYIYVYT